MIQFAESEPASRSEQDLSSAGEFNEVLLAMAAHDLRQPLQVILSAFAWLERHDPVGRERQYVELGELAARRLMSDATLRSILCNLIRNAIKYTPKSGRILVGCRGSGLDVRIEVHDTGIYIPSDYLSKVFDAFHRLDSSEPDGLGLGLFVVRRAADLLGHRVGVRSTVGHGSCFSILAGTGRAGNRSTQKSIEDRPASL